MRLLELKENDNDHRAALQQTGFWGRQGAGCIILAQDTGRICLAHRSDAVEQPNTWGTWGGAIDSGENPQAAAQREVREEAGYRGPMKLVPLYIFKHSSGFTYYNFLAIVAKEFKPKMDWETQNYAWIEFGRWPAPLHPGLKALLSDPESLETIRRATPHHPQQGQHHPNIETIGFGDTRHNKLEAKESLVEYDEDEEGWEEKHFPSSKFDIHDVLNRRRLRLTARNSEALRDYSEESTPLNSYLHKHYRKEKQIVDRNNTAQKFAKTLDTAFKHATLTKNLKVYTGIPESPGRIWEKYRADPTKPVRVHLPAYTSTTTDFRIAYVSFSKLDYTVYKDHKPRNVLKGNLNLYSMGVVKQGVKEVFDGYQMLYIIVPAGYQAISMVDLSNYGDEEEEILLPRGLDIEIEPNPYVKTTPNIPVVVWFAKVVGHNPVVLT
jgi:8-oxo-dGTP pyrophosphatase MutT (NUDIX family)